MIDLESVRSDTPHADTVMHLNNAGCSPPPTVVRAAINDYWDREEFGGYEAKLESAEQFEKVYENLARLIDCSPKEIYLTENGTESWQLAVTSLGLAEGDRVLTGECEYSSNLIQLQRLYEEFGVEVQVIESDLQGQVSLEALKQAIDERTKLIALTHIPTNCGLINPAAEVGKIARAFGVPFILDAVQSVGQMPLSVSELGCDILTATGRKFIRGPRGTGFLYVSEHIKPKICPFFLDNSAASLKFHDDGTRSIVIAENARIFERYDSNFGLRLGLGAAAQYALALGLDNIWQRISGLAEKLRHELKNVDGVAVHDVGQYQCGIVAFTVAGKEPSHLKEALRKTNVNVSVSRAPSTPYDMIRRNLKSVVRASVHYFNAEQEIETFAKKIASLRR